MCTIYYYCLYSSILDIAAIVIVVSSGAYVYRSVATTSTSAVQRCSYQTLSGTSDIGVKSTRIMQLVETGDTTNLV